MARLDWEAKARRWAQMLEWEVIWPRAIARAWEDAEFKKKLIQDPRGTFESELDYPLNPELTLTIKEGPEGTVQYDAGKPGGDPWENMPMMELTLYLPPAPKDHKDWAIAIANYTGTGRTYPFTTL